MGRSWRCVSERVRRTGLRPSPTQCAQCRQVFIPSLAGFQRYCSAPCQYKAAYAKDPRAWCKRSRRNEKLRRGKLPKTFEKWTDEERRALWEEYRGGRRNMVDFATAKGYGDNLLRCLFRACFPDGWADEVERRKGKASAYKRGRNFEHRVMDYLKGRGFWTLRSPMSAGPADLVAIRKGENWLVQCKVSRQYFTKRQRAELLSLAESIGSRAVLAFRDPALPHWEIRLEGLDGRPICLDTG